VDIPCQGRLATSCAAVAARPTTRPEASTMPLRIIVDVFSGRPNPVIELDGKEA
jgi:hypothetical protein